GGAAHNIDAFDEGVDTILHIPWCTARRGRWTLIGQTTCAMSNAWKAKMVEASPWTWAGLLGEKIPSLTLCAVPHHTERKHSIYLIETRRRILCDRLSLVAHKPQVSGQDQAIVDAVIAGGVEPI